MRLYEKTSYPDDLRKIIKICGLNFWDTKKNNNETIKKFLYGIIKIKQTQIKKTIYILGIKIYSKRNEQLKLLQDIINNINFTRANLRNEIQQTIIDETRMANAVSQLHANVFPKFKNCHKNQYLAIVGTGPTLIHYKFMQNLVHVGLNKAFLANNIKKLDYSFAIDYFAVKNYIEELKNNKCIKFFGMQANINLDLLEKVTAESTCIPEYIADKVGALRFYADAHREKFFPNIEACPLIDRGSIAFPALHFALYTAPQKIFLIGCDTNHNGYFDDTNDNYAWQLLGMALDGYKKFKSFVDIYYPNIEIISVNPVGLRGLFRDVYTRSYVAENPELFTGIENKIEYFEDIVQTGGHNRYDI